MARTIRQDRRDGVAIIALSQPPLNTLTRQMRGDLDHALAQAIGDPEVTAIVLHGLGEAAARGLSAGLDLREAEAGFAAPQVSDICRRIEDSATPVVAILHGVTLGAGAELALAAHARLATGEASIGFPDVIMGLCPGAGGSQRLPRFLGAQGALDLLLSQHPRPLRSRLLRPLVDRLVPEDDDAEAAAIALAQSVAADVAAGGTLPRASEMREGLADFAANAAAIAARRAQVAASPNIAGARIVDCVEAACLLPFEAGLAFEAVAFEDLLASDVSNALRHATYAELRAVNMPEMSGATPSPVGHVALVGGGVAAANLAVVFLEAGLPVVQFERSDDALSLLKERIAAGQAALVRAGRMKPEAAEAQIARWQGTTRLTDLAVADLLIEAVADTLSTKQQVMAALDRLAPQGAVLVTTSALHDIGQIAATTARPDAVLGLRLAAPAHMTRLAEVIPGPATSDAAIARMVTVLTNRLGRIPVRCSTGGGGMGELILCALREAGAGMLRLGASPASVDSALQGYGFAHGLFRQMDLMGLETCLAQGRSASTRLDTGQQHLGDLDRLVMAGRTGKAAGRGYHLWQDAKPQEDRAVMAILDLPGAEEGGGRPPLSPEAIVLRAVAAMANAGARALRAGIALRPSDIDAVMIQGYGFPRWHGGPMKAADLVGLFEILQALKRFSAENPALYTPDPGFAALVKEGQTFDALNRLGRNRRVIPG
ncbi:MAG: 3-hydroxyacyl-CoA dehydrogenase NAD-binding domain-containing protein [Paracoccaceae bacterium]|nr:3-hydroxyacyl-CoA dehydrogenase NAD-binding domain-containing protein [Paracoccaceae bacterium]